MGCGGTRREKGDLLVAWDVSIQIKSIIKRDFCVELLVEPEMSEDSFWTIFVYVSTEIKERKRETVGILDIKKVALGY